MQNPRDCPICRQLGSTWCPHEPPPGRTPQPPGARQQPSSSAEQWTPARTALLLKAALYIGVGAGVWCLLRPGAEPDTLEPEAGEPGAGDYSNWEPES
jgi:hypothetical protein